MKTTLTTALVLLACSGLLVVWKNFGPRRGGPSEADIVYTNNGVIPTDPSQVEKAPPSHPPEDDPWISEFELTERSGRKIKSDDLLGHPYIVSFFFSTCPSVCVSQNQRIQELQEEFLGEDVRFVAISVDPETDTPEKLREYAARFAADDDQWLFLTGDLQAIRKVGVEAFRQPIDKQFHSEKFMLVDHEGKVEGIYSWPEKRHLNKLRERIREMIDNETS